jgi:copper chaperone
MPEVQDVVLSVPDVSCEHCVKTIDGALGSLPGVESVATDIPTKSVHLRFDSRQLSMEQIATALDDAGYTLATEPQPALRTWGKPLTLL